MSSPLSRRALLGTGIATGVVAWIGPSLLATSASIAGTEAPTDLIVNGGFEDEATGWMFCDPNRACLEAA